MCSRMPGWPAVVRLIWICLSDGGVWGGDDRFADCLSRLNEAVTELGEVDLSALSEEMLTAGAADLAKAVSRLGAARGRMLVAIEKNESWRATGARTIMP